MNTAIKIALGSALLLGVAAAGYWLGKQDTGHGIQETGAGQGSARKVLYYRNPMGLPDTSPVPKKDAMGMDYVPVYEGEETTDTASVRVSPDKVQALGVKSEPAQRRNLQRELRLNASIAADEGRIVTIAPRFEGWVEKLYVNTTGQTVQRGAPLFSVYSPDLLTARRELQLAQQGLAALHDADAGAQHSMQRMVDAAAARLKNWDIASADLQGERIVYRAPTSGIVLEKRAQEGMRFMPGERLYQIADLSSVWVVADVNEQDIAAVHVGSPAQVTLDALPGRVFSGKVEFIYPTLDSATRTVPLRIVVRNPDGALKPAMYAHVQLAGGSDRPVLAVPRTAVIDSGDKQTVLLRREQGRFEPRTVTLGARNDDYVEVTGGLSEGDEVVTSGNFLIDSESNLQAALGGMETSTPQQPTAVGHQADGVLEAINDDGTVSITHQPIASLKWPGMTMDFALANPALLAHVAPGSTIHFEIVERSPGEWVITQLHSKERHHAEHDH
ncbi:MAG: efflux RND transporter periplasmic adaptor subunit [Pseudomonadota bacterium]